MQNSAYGERESGVKYYLGETKEKNELTESELERDLGIWIGKDLKWGEQCGKAAKKAMTVLGMIKRSFEMIDEKGFIILYNTYVRPHLEYCVQAWSPYLMKDIECLEKVQRRATKMICGFNKLTYEERLKRLKLYTLEERRVRGDLIEVYKIVTGKEKIDSRRLFQMANTGYLRGNSLKLFKKPARLELRRKYFTMRVVENWNKLPDSVVLAESVEVFKNILDEWMLRYRH